MPPSTTPSITTDEHWIRLPGGRLFARSWTPAGDPAGGAPIALLHDSLGCVALWRDFPEALATATGRRVIAYDRLGFGRSDARAGRPALDFIADEARTGFPALREQLGLARFVAFGHSVGGGMAVHCAAGAGRSCEGLITIAAQVFVEDRTVAGIRSAQSLFTDPAQRERLARYHGDKADWVFDAWTGCWLDPGFADWSLRSVLPQVRCPVLAVHGVDDEYGSTRHPELIGELAGGPARVEVMADTRHVPHRERPQEVLDHITRFLDNMAARPTP